MFDSVAYKKLWYQEHREESILRAKRYAETHKEKNKASKDKYRKIHKEEIKLKRWWQTPKGKKTAQRVREKWRRTPQGKIAYKVYAHNRRLLTKDLTIEIVQSVYEDNIKRFGTLTCYLCLDPIFFGNDNLDHKIPISRGGSNKKDNLDIACEFCNCSKGDKTIEEFKRGEICIA